MYQSVCPDHNKFAVIDSDSCCCWHDDIGWQHCMLHVIALLPEECIVNQQYQEEQYQEELKEDYMRVDIDHQLVRYS